jgi:hypothetical protein
MSRILSPERRAFTVLLAAVFSLLSSGLTAAQFKWMVGGDKNTKYQGFKDPAGPFRARVSGEKLEAPADGWIEPRCVREK